mmetsp:Transcript_10994/g.25110  ORF Transcript_10994/g.25110 Transcript_10994/m.25110 type:complete len:523 (-) Transcript_10994:4-1572(-)
MSIEVQKQIKDNSTEISEYFQDLLRWEEEEGKRENRRERVKSGAIKGGGGGSASSSAPPPRAEQTVSVKSGAPKSILKTRDSQDGTAANKATESAPIARDTQPMPQYYNSWENFDAEAEADKLDETSLEEQRQEREARQAEKDRIADELAFNEQTGDRRRTSTARPLVKVRVKAAGRRASPVDLAIPKKEEANRYFAEGRFREAIATYSVALEYLEKYEPVGEESGPSADLADGNGNEDALALKVALLSNRAAAFLKVEEWRSASDDATEALRYDPKHEKAVLRRGMAYAKMKRWAAAAKDLQQAVETDPSYKKAAAELQMVRRMLASQLKEGRSHAQAIMCDPTRESTMPTRRLTVGVKGKSAPAPVAEQRKPEGASLEPAVDSLGGLEAQMASSAAPRKYVPRSVRLREAIEQRKAASKPKASPAAASASETSRVLIEELDGSKALGQPSVAPEQTSKLEQPVSGRLDDLDDVVPPAAAAAEAPREEKSCSEDAAAPAAEAVEAPPKVSRPAIIELDTCD